MENHVIGEGIAIEKSSLEVLAYRVSQLFKKIVYGTDYDNAIQHAKCLINASVAQANLSQLLNEDLEQDAKGFVDRVIESYQDPRDEKVADRISMNIKMSKEDFVAASNRHLTNMGKGYKISIYWDKLQKHLLQEDWNEGIKVAKEALKGESRPSKKVALQLRMITGYHNLKNFTEAKKLYKENKDSIDQAVRKRPGIEQYYFYKKMGATYALAEGLTLEDKEDKKEARRFYLEAVELYEKNIGEKTEKWCALYQALVPLGKDQEEKTSFLENALFLENKKAREEELHENVESLRSELAILKQKNQDQIEEERNLQAKLEQANKNNEEARRWIEQNRQIIAKGTSAQPVERGAHFPFGLFNRGVPRSLLSGFGGVSENPYFLNFSNGLGLSTRKIEVSSEFEERAAQIMENVQSSSQNLVCSNGPSTLVQERDLFIEGTCLLTRVSPLALRRTRHCLENSPVIYMQRVGAAYRNWFFSSFTRL